VLPTAPIRLEAPWDRGHVVITVLATTLCLTGALMTGWAAVALPEDVPRWIARAGFVLCIAPPLLAWLFMPRAFTLQPGELTIHRRLGRRRFTGVADPRPVDPFLVHGAYRVLGSGGPFGTYGHYRHSVLGNFRLYARRRMGFVAVTTSEGTVVLAPSDPEAVMRALGGQQGGANG
jgi:hypothetical protein